MSHMQVDREFKIAFRQNCEITLSQREYHLTSTYDMSQRLETVAYLRANAIINFARTSDLEI